MKSWSGWTDLDVMSLARSADNQPMGQGRPSGLHLSGIIHKMKVAAGDPIGMVPGDQDGVRLQEGFLWETALEYVLAGMPLDEAIGLSFSRYMHALRSDVSTQITLEQDGVHMTPDGFLKDKGELESYKCTRKSFAKAITQEEFETNFWPWLVQEMGYAYALGVDTVSWYVLFQAGDYSKGRGTGPRMVKSTGVFTPEELIENWRVVMIHAKGAKHE